MHRLYTVDGSWRQSKFLRFARTVSYLSITASGMLLLFSSLEGVYGILGDAMMLFLVLGGFSAALGSITYRWAGEFLGIPLLSPAFTVLGVLIWDQSFDSAPVVATANLFLLISFSLLLLGRWRVVLAVFRFAERNTEEPKTTKGQ